MIPTPSDSPLSTVARVIQLSVAPVFLLTAVSTILGVLGTRLGRVVDRARGLVDRSGRATRRSSRCSCADGA